MSINGRPRRLSDQVGGQALDPGTDSPDLRRRALLWLDLQRKLFLKPSTATRWLLQAGATRPPSWPVLRAKVFRLNRLLGSRPAGVCLKSAHGSCLKTGPSTRPLFERSPTLRRFCSREAISSSLTGRLWPLWGHARRLNTASISLCSLGKDWLGLGSWWFLVWLAGLMRPPIEVP